MAFSLTSHLIHDEGVPTRAREALRSADAAAPEQRHALLKSAARILYAETGLACEDVKELVGLPEMSGCG